MFKKIISIYLVSVIFLLNCFTEICFAANIQKKAEKTNKSEVEQNSELKENSFTIKFYYRDKDNKRHKIIYSSSSNDFKVFADNHSKLNFRQQAILYMLSKYRGYNSEIEEKILSNDYYITQHTNTYDDFSQLNFYDKLDDNNFDDWYKLYLKKDFLNNIENLKKYRFYSEYYNLPSNIAEHLMADTKYFTDKYAINLIENNIKKYRFYRIDYKREPFKENFKKYLKSGDHYSDNTNEIIKESTYNYTRNLDLIDFILDNGMMEVYERAYNVFNNGKFSFDDYRVEYIKNNEKESKWVKFDKNCFDNKKENYYRDLMIITIIYCKSINKEDIVLLPEFEATEADLEKTISFIGAHNSDRDKIIIDKKEYNNISEVDFKKLKKNSKITIITNNKKMIFVPCKKTDVYLKYKKYNTFNAFIDEAPDFLSGVGFDAMIIFFAPIILFIYYVYLPLVVSGPKEIIKDAFSRHHEKHKEPGKLYYMKRDKEYRDRMYKKYMMIE